MKCDDCVYKKEYKKLTGEPEEKSMWTAEDERKDTIEMLVFEIVVLIVWIVLCVLTYGG